MAGWRLRLAATLAVAAVLCSSTHARAEADPEAKAKAEVLFSQAMKLSEHGDYARACESLEEAVRLTEREAIGGILELARCQEKLGKTASAWALYREVKAKASQSGQSEREREATRAADELEPRLHLLELVLAPGLAETKGLSIRQGSLELGRAAWTVPTPVDPGEVVIEVRAPGKRGIVRKLRIPAKPGTTRVTLPAFDAPHAEAPPPPPEKSEATDTHGGWSATRVAGAVVTGAGVATMATSGVLILIAKSQWNDAHSSECNGNVCSPDGKQRIDAARDKGTLATIVFGAGAALTVTGAVLFLTAPSSRPESAREPRLSVSAAAWQHGGGMAMGGHF